MMYLFNRIILLLLILLSILDVGKTYRVSRLRPRPRRRKLDGG